jgi:hypothetical protein
MLPYVLLLAKPQNSFSLTLIVDIEVTIPVKAVGCYILLPYLCTSIAYAI